MSLEFTMMVQSSEKKYEEKEWEKMEKRNSSNDKMEIESICPTPSTILIKVTPILSEGRVPS